MTTGTPDTAAAEARLEELAPGYLAKVRAAAAALAVDAHGGGSVAVEVAAVREAAEFDLDVPTMSMNPAGSYVKEAVKRATSWYLRYLTVQVAGFARSVTSMGEALATQLERLDRVDADQAGELEALRERVAKLEAAGGQAGAGGR